MEVKVNLGKKSLVSGLVLLILLALYNILFFVIPFNRDLSGTAFWITYGITTFLIVFMAVVICLGVGDKDLKSRVFGLPIIRLGYGVLVFQLVIDAIVMSVGSFFEVQAWIPIIVEALLLAVFFISLIARTAYKDTIKKIDEQKVRKEFINEFRIQLDVFSKKVENKELKEELEKLIETVKYTNPVSNENTIQVEDEICDKFEELKAAHSYGDFEASKKIVNKISTLFEERSLRSKK